MSQRRQGQLRDGVHVGDHDIGPRDAPVTLVEYGDFECPYCYRAHPIIEDIQAAFGDRLRFVFRNFPLEQLHPHALHAAAAAESVAANAGTDAYWAMHHAIFEHQQDSGDALDDAHLVRYAAAAGADPVQVKLDLDQGTFEDRVHEDFISGVRSGVNGTPTFFINGERFDGDWTDKTAFASALEDAASKLREVNR
jgi:protein-disulfide isomerase